MRMSRSCCSRAEEKGESSIETNKPTDSRDWKMRTEEGGRHDKGKTQGRRQRKIEMQIKKKSIARQKGDEYANAETRNEQT